jgi:hypothetical protein
MVKTLERRQKEDRAYRKKLNKLKRGRRFGRFKADSDSWWSEYPKGKILSGNYHNASCRCEYCMSLSKKRFIDSQAKEEIKDAECQD